jgi:hypothetical protein
MKFLRSTELKIRRNRIINDIFGEEIEIYNLLEFEEKQLHWFKYAKKMASTWI